MDILSDNEIRALLKACESGNRFAARRDTAMIRMLADIGPRREELMGLTLDDVDLDGKRARLLGKGGKTRIVGFGDKTAVALDAYLRDRSRHKDADLDALWLATTPHRGAMGVDGLRLMLNRRAREAGLSHVHPHRFRHTAYAAYRRANVDGSAAMSHFGWSTRQMLDHYGASAAEEHAIETAHKLAVGDRI